MPKLIYLVTEDWYFWSHRLPVARAARAAGFEVGVATRVREHGDRILAEGFRLHPLSWQPGRRDPLDAAAAIGEIARLYRRERPDLVHHVAMKPVVLGGVAARLAGVPAVVHALTGLGTLFLGRSTRARLVRRGVGLALRRLLDHGRSRVILQNQDDLGTLVAAGILRPERSVLIRGSGIDTGHFQALPEPPAPPVTAAYVGRMLEDKGIRTLIAAQQALQRQGRAVRLVLAGTPDPDNVTSIPERELTAWAGLPGIAWPGWCGDVRAVWAAAHIAVLPSRREGLPKSLLEAAACGRAIIATDVPGCREIARAGENALLVPPGDPAALAEALARLAEDAELRHRFAAASRRLVETDLAADRVGAATVALYRELLAAAV